jgi:hypothetical protein
MILRPALAALALLAAVPSHAQQQPAAIDPARLAMGDTIANTVFPAGTYKRMMGETMSKLMNGMMGSMMKLPVREIVTMSGLPTDQVTKLNETSLEEISAIVDPHFRERTKLMMDTMFASMGDLMTTFEPRLRAALARSFARKFDPAQLGEIRAFFATPTGSKFAGDYMTMFLEPEIMGEMQGMMPEMMKKMPEMLAPAIKATEKLPEPRKFSDLTPAEQDKLATLLGIAPADLRKSASRAEKDKK